MRCVRLGKCSRENRVVINVEKCISAFPIRSICPEDDNEFVVVGVWKV